MTELATRKVRYKASGHVALINVTDFNPDVHEDPDELSSGSGFETRVAEAMNLEELEQLEHEAGDLKGKAKKAALAAIDARREQLQSKE